MLTIRDYLDHFIDRRVVDITSHDPKIDDASKAQVTLMFDDGSYMRFRIADVGVDWGTVNTCLDHSGCIMGEQEPPLPDVLINVRRSAPSPATRTPPRRSDPHRG